jgi:hypothetical protein
MEIAMTTNQISYDNLFALFQCAISNNLKYPKLRFQMEKDTLIVKLNGAKSRYEGSIALTNDAGFGSLASRYYGRIEKNGGLIGGRDLTPAVEALLQRIAADPIGVAAELGKLHGNCVFCGKALTDQTSAAFGYGKICSAKYNLPYTSKGKARKSMPTQNFIHDGAIDPATEAQIDAEMAQDELTLVPSGYWRVDE